jgi:hypothetical protein
MDGEVSQKRNIALDAVSLTLDQGKNQQWKPCDGDGAQHLSEHPPAFFSAKAYSKQESMKRASTNERKILGKSGLHYLHCTSPSLHGLTINTSMGASHSSAPA